MRKLNSVHFLRFAAALAVAVHHFLGTLSGASGTTQGWIAGASGVDVFFVISGIVIGLALERDGVLGFVAKRLIRVLPLLFLGTAIYVFTMNFASGITFAPVDIIHSLVLWPSGDPNWYPIHSPSWTIQYELAFYSISAIFMALFRESRRALCAIFIVFIGVIQIPNFLSTSIPVAYFSTNFFLGFGAGLIVAEMISHNVYWSRKVGSVLILTALSALALSNLSMSIKSTGSEIAIQWGIPSALLVVGFLAFDNSRWMRNRFIVLGGDASYAIYMTHLSVLQMIFYIGNVLNFTLDKHPLIFAAVTIPSMIAFGAVTHLFVEKPILSWLKKHILPLIETEVPKNADLAEAGS